MNESSENGGNLSNEVEQSPTDLYRSSLHSYTILTKKIRQAERLMGNPREILKLDRQRSSIHQNEIIPKALILGKSDEDIKLDMLLSEGNMEAYGIRQLPLVELPMVDSWSKQYNDLDREQDGFRSDSEDYYFQNLRSPDGNSLGSVQKEPYSMDELRADNFSELPERKIILKGENLLERWQNNRYFALLYATFQETNYVIVPDKQYCDLYTTRLARMKQLSTDFGLNLYKTNVTEGHQDYGPRVLYGVEIPNNRIDEIAKAIKENPGKYWLTDDEINNPYKTDYLVHEDEKVLIDGLDYFYIHGNWQIFLNYLEALNIKSRGITPKDKRYIKAPEKQIRAVIEREKSSDPKTAEEMERQLEANLEYLRTIYIPRRR